MNKRIIALILVMLMIIPSAAFAHPGRTDSSGGHNCSAKSKAKGLCSGYHYHNGGGSSSSSSSSSASSSSKYSSSNSVSNNKPSSSKSFSTKSSSIQYKKANTDIYLNSKLLSFDDSPIVISNTTLVPLRAIADIVGASLQYDAKTKVIQLEKSNKSVVLVINSKTMKVNNVASTLNVAPVIYKGTTYVPIKVLSLGLGITVSYDSSVNSIYIET